MSWQNILKDDKILANIIRKFADDTAEPHIKLIQLWAELKDNIPEEDGTRFESEIENIGQTLMKVGKAVSELVIRHDITLNSTDFQEDKA